MLTHYKLTALTAAIVGTLAWLAAGGVDDSRTYYKTVAEVVAAKDQSTDHRFRVGGDVSDQTIVRTGKEVRFTMVQIDGPKRFHLPVVYSGIEPLPDTFRPGAQALADGKLGPDGVFHATKIQAKCASKYEGKPIT